MKRALQRAGNITESELQCDSGVIDRPAAVGKPSYSNVPSGWRTGHQARDFPKSSDCVTNNYHSNTKQRKLELTSREVLSDFGRSLYI
jgi:hypothetical protein